jgi:hypothetical protein
MRYTALYSYAHTLRVAQRERGGGGKKKGRREAKSNSSATRENKKREKEDWIETFLEEGRNTMEIVGKCGGGTGIFRRGIVTPVLRSKSDDTLGAKMILPYAEMYKYS